jgi:hypothetical protein
MMQRKDFRVEKKALEDPKKCQNRELKLNYITIGV